MANSYTKLKFCFLSQLANGIAIKAVHLIYWSNHPRAVSILEKYRDALDVYMENQGAPTPGLMTLTTGKKILPKMVDLTELKRSQVSFLPEILCLKYCYMD